MNRSLSLVACLGAIICLVGCATRPATFPASWQRTVQKGDAVSSAFESGEGEIFIVPDDQINAMPPCRGTVVLRVPCAAVFKTADGMVVHLGGPGATPEVAGFVATLEEGQTYAFPDAFAAYQKAQGERPKEPNAGGAR